MSAQPLLRPVPPQTEGADRAPRPLNLAAVAGSAKLSASEEQAVRGDAWFSSLVAELQHAILARATVRRLRAGVVLTRGSGSADALMRRAKFRPDR